MQNPRYHRERTKPDTGRRFATRYGILMLSIAISGAMLTWPDCEALRAITVSLLVSVCFGDMVAAIRSY